MSVQFINNLTTSDPQIQEHSHSHGLGEHGHSHDQLDHPGKFAERDLPDYTSRNFEERGFTVGIGG